MISPLEHPTWEARINENTYEITLSYDENPEPVTKWLDLFRDTKSDSKIPVVIYRDGYWVKNHLYAPDSDYSVYTTCDDFQDEFMYRLRLIEERPFDHEHSGVEAGEEHHYRQMMKKVGFISVGAHTLAYPLEWSTPQNRNSLKSDLRLYTMWAEGDVFHIEAMPLDGLSESVDLWGEYLPYDIATGFNEAELKQATEMIVKGYL